MTTTADAAAPVLLVEVEDLADGDLRAVLDAGLDVAGPAPAEDAAALVEAVRRSAAVAVAAHGLAERAARLVR